jgi:predicted DCC family thiol-disulfide oxidoreductase YuxK
LPNAGAPEPGRRSDEPGRDARTTLDAVEQAVILYDADCGFCRWSLHTILAWDSANLLRPVALQDPEADRLLKGMDHRQKMGSWHLVTPDGAIYSAGAAVPPLMEILPAGKPLAVVASTFPKATESLYQWVARNRGTLGRLLASRSGRSTRDRRPSS